ncbi:hypothetical protein [Butyrivibrio sp. XPD2006]|uniref:hypothetical protein n=1 Tax=Butyrivibrio sp. XPD2006 TaxID=1280668 RepID=UPI0003B4FD43|nr:hypothetical protein [Butyrivibrio sp. XPD2006]
MKKSRYLQAALIVGLTLIMTGCGEKFPDLTEEQYKQTVEYAAGLLMKYSNNGQERLVVVDVKEVLKERQKEAARAAELELAKEKAAKNKAEQQIPTPVQETEPVEPEEQNLTTDPDTGVEIEQTQGEESTETEESTTTADPNAIVLSSDESQEIMQDIFLSYQGYMVSSTYPESSKSYVVNADKGKKLLVLRFDLYNGSDSSKSVNMIPLGLSFKIILNGKDLGYSSVTFLPNDLSSYAGTIDSRAHESVVVLTQISDSDSTKIESLGMNVTIKGETETVILK